MTEQRANPYVGPRSYSEDEADLFFGREREAERLLSLVISQRLVLFTAQSGAGKSSLVNTRLLPGLRREGFETLPIGRVSGVLPPEVLNVQNIFAFNLIITLAGGGSTALDLARSSLPEFLAGSKHGPREDGEPELARALVIDQFEEILTAHLERWREREAFFHQLREALRADPLLWVILVMREDHVAALDPYARLLPGRLRTRYYMQRMEPAAALEAVREPAKGAGCPFASSVGEKLVDNLRLIRVQEREKPIKSQFVEPVHLQLVCHQLWRNLQSRERLPEEISHDDLTELGDVDTALTQFFEHAVRETLDEVGGSEIELYRWFRDKLITESGTRGTVHRGAETTAGLDNEVVEALVDRFLLRSETRAGGIWYELSHDRFVQPVLAAGITWVERQDALTRAALEWDQSGRDRRFLYLGGQLERARESVRGERLEPLVAEFLEAAGEASEELEGELKTAKKLRRLVTWLVTIVGGIVLSYLALLVISIATYEVPEGQETGSATAEVWFGVLGMTMFLAAALGIGMLISRGMLAIYRNLTERRKIAHKRLKILRAKLVRLDARHPAS